LKFNNLSHQCTEAIFEGIGKLLAPMFPRCCDNTSKTRKNAVNAIGMILYIDYLLSLPNGAEPTPSQVLKPLNAIRSKIFTSDQQEQYVACHDLAKVLCEAISSQEIEGLFIELIKTALVDSDVNGQEAVCVITNTLCKGRGSETTQIIPKIINLILGSLKTAKSDTVRKGIYSCVRALAQHHLTSVLQTLLEQPMPHSDGVIESLQAIAGDKKLYEKLTAKLLFNINNGRLHEESCSTQHRAFS